MEVYAAYKICLFGEGGVGKTALTRRFLTGLFDLDTKMTMGASIYVKYVELAEKKIALQIWDFGGEEQFKFLLPVYSHGSAAAIFMVDISRYTTIKNIDDWLKFFDEGLQEGEKSVPILLVGGKSDLEEKRAIPKQKGTEICKEHNLLDYIECSAKTGENVEEVFEILVKEIGKRKGII